MNKVLLAAVLSLACIQSMHAQTLKKLEWSGDLRYRLAKFHEDIDQDRSLQQLRARLGLRAEVNDDTKAILRLATATSSVSQDQTLGDSTDPGMARRGFGLDLAYVDWNFLQFGQVWAGRTANPYYRLGSSQLIFSEDLAFEGMALRWNPHWSHSAAFANVSGSVISENYLAPDDLVDTGLLGWDLGYSHSGESWTATLKVGTYYYLNIQDKAITATDKNADVDPYSYPYDSFRGNSIYPNDPLLPKAQRKYYFTNEYIIMEIGAEWRQQLGPIEYRVFYDEVKNDKVRVLNKAKEYGVRVTGWKLWLEYAESVKRRDAVVGTFTDSRMNGGGTDNSGSRVQLGVNLKGSVSLALSHYRARRGIDTVSREYVLDQVDLNVAF